MKPLAKFTFQTQIKRTKTDNADIAFNVDILKRRRKHWDRVNPKIWNKTTLSFELSLMIFTA